MSQACVLDTELMTVRVCGKDLSYSTPEQLLGAQREGVDPSLGGGDEGKFHFEVCGSQMVCFPHTDRLECMVHLAWTATVSADGMSLDAASHQAADPLPPHVAAALAGSLPTRTRDPHRSSSLERISVLRAIGVVLAHAR